MTRELLNELAEIYAARDAAMLAKQELIDQVITPEIKAHIAEIEAEFAANLEVANRRAAALEEEIILTAKSNGSSAKGKILQVVYNPGGYSVAAKDAEALANRWEKTNPAFAKEVRSIIKKKADSASIKPVGGKT